MQIAPLAFCSVISASSGYPVPLEKPQVQFPIWVRNRRSFRQVSSFGSAVTHGLLHTSFLHTRRTLALNGRAFTLFKTAHIWALRVDISDGK
ncbi:hypothetical protein GGP87_000997 [Salinibacter ruber]|nr:hypothetical protein [Salinibacter ruber]